jgi:CubicO group peptidase (beta-lactamase class C family)
MSDRNSRYCECNHARAIQWRAKSSEKELIMKRTVLVCAAALMLLPACSRQKLDPALASYIDSLMNSLYKSDQPGAVILVAKDGEPVFRKAYGLANLELNVPNTPENVFAIASMTKQFTAVCVLQLLQQEKLSLQDDIRKYLPGYNTHGRLITVEHLLTHTNGIPNVTVHPDFYRKEILEPSREELLNCSANDSLLFEPGTDWSYNDVGFIMAAFIVERASGMPFHEYMRKNIFDPAGMKNTTFGTRERVIPRMVTGYTPGEGESYRPEEYYSWTWGLGMGEIVTTVDDMLRWDEALYTEKLVKRDLLERAWTSYALPDGQKANYGYGWWVSQPGGIQIIVHPGAIGGFRSFSFRIPSQHLFVVFLSNNARVGYTGPLESLSSTLAGLTRDIPPGRAISAEKMKEYTGVYEMGFLRIVSAKDVTREELYRTITAHDTFLISQQAGGRKVHLRNIGEDSFVADDLAVYFRFRRDAGGKIIALERHMEPISFGPVRTERKTDHPLPKERDPITLDESALKTFAGKYNFGGDHSSRVHVEGGRIYMQGVGDLLPESGTRFFVKDADVEVEFLKNPEGVVIGLILKQGWVEEARKVE